MSLRGRTTACVILASILAGTAAPAARATTPADQEAAQRAFGEAKDLYKRGSYREAIEKLEQARRLDASAKELPYNLGTVYEKVGNLEKAIEYFGLYLTLEKDEAERERTKETIKRLEGALADKRRSAATAPSRPSAERPEAPPRPADEPAAVRGPRRLTTPVVTLGAVSVVSLLAGTYFGIKALRSQPTDPVTGPDKRIRDLDQDVVDTKNSSRAADALFAVSLVTGGLATYFYLSQERPLVSGSAVVLPGGAATRWEVRF